MGFYDIMLAKKFGGSDGGGSISTLSDVNLVNLVDGQILEYNSNSSKWKNQTLATVATTGDYDDLVDKPSIPSILQASITLDDAAWVGDEQTVIVVGMTTTSSVFVSPVPAFMEDYVNAGIYCSAQGTDSLTFTKIGSISADINVNILAIEGGA